jgi:hypothetical protein
VAGTPFTLRRVTDEQVPTGAVYAALAVLGAVLGLFGAFLVPQRLPGGVEGFSVLLALVGNAVVGAGATRMSGSVPASVMPGIGWLVALLLTIGYLQPSDEAVIPSALASDPGIGTVGALYLFAGPVGTILAVWWAQRFTRRAEWPKQSE